MTPRFLVSRCPNCEPNGGLGNGGGGSPSATKTDSFIWIIPGGFGSGGNGGGGSPSAITIDSLSRITEGIGGKGGGGSPSALRPYCKDCADGNSVLEILPPKASRMLKVSTVENPTEMKTASILFMDKILLRSEGFP